MDGKGLEQAHVEHSDMSGSSQIGAGFEVRWAQV